jgi:tripartite-type tricarboxylate transporter receptor subunit TctC
MHDGGGDSLASVLGGQVDAVLIDKMFVEQVKGQDVTVLASFGAERLDVIKDIPTMTELGYSVTDSITRLILAPKDTPKEIVDRLSEATQTATDTPGFLEKMAKMSEVYKFLGTVERKEMVQKDFTELKDFLTKNPDILGTK